MTVDYMYYTIQPSYTRLAPVNMLNKLFSKIAMIYNKRDICINSKTEVGNVIG